MCYECKKYLKGLQKIVNEYNIIDILDIDYHKGILAINRQYIKKCSNYLVFTKTKIKG